jgi:hypothetical protein
MTAGKDHKVPHVIIYTGARGGDRGHIISNKLSGRNPECLELKRRNYGALKSNACAFIASNIICRFLTIYIFHSFILYFFIRCVKCSFNDMVKFIYSYTGFLNLQIYVFSSNSHPIDDLRILVYILIPRS